MSSLIAQLPDSGLVRILSDLHLGHDLSTVRSVESLRPLIAGAARVIFNGDTLQERAGVFRERSLAMVAGLQELCVEEGAESVFLRGNHDPTFWPLELVDLMQGLVTVTHGDAWLRLISPWSVSMNEYRRVLEAIHAEYPDAAWQDLDLRFEILQRCRLALPAPGPRPHGSSLVDRVAFLCREMWPPRRPLEVMKVYAQLPRLASGFAATFRPQSRILIFGHTHRARVWRRDGRLLLNTGAFVTFARPVMAEIRDGLLEAWYLEDRGGAWQKQRVLVKHRFG